MKPIVVDASALVMMLIEPGDSGETVAELLNGRDIHAPDLLPYEVANVLRRHRAAGRLSPAEADLAYRASHRLAMELWSYEILGDRIWALTGSLSTYDAAYIALAERLGAPLLTADLRLARGSAYEHVTVV